MINPVIFKAYDVRGRYPEEINEEAAAGIATALAKYFKRGKVVVCRDARLSSPSLYEAVLQSLKIENPPAGRAGSKLEIIPIGISTTPMFYFLVNDLKASGGVMVTASHNPKEFNGLKIVGQNAEPMNGHEIHELYKKLQ